MYVPTTQGYVVTLGRYLGHTKRSTPTPGIDSMIRTTMHASTAKRKISREREMILSSIDNQCAKVRITSN